VAPQFDGLATTVSVACGQHGIGISAHADEIRRIRMALACQPPAPSEIERLTVIPWR
jgi:hypothetical protein